MTRALLVALLLVVSGARTGRAQVAVAGADSVSIRIVDVELRAAIQMLGQYLDRPIIVPANATMQVTLESPVLIARSDILRTLRGLLDSHGFDLTADSSSGLYRVRQREQARPAPVAPSGLGRSTTPVELFVIPLQHARAIDVASMINSLYGRGSTAAEASTRVPTLGEELRGNQLGAQGPAPNAGGAGPPSRPASLSGELVVVADLRGNSLLVRANGSDIALIREVVAALDVRPLQVLIEVIIAEIRKDRSIGLNVEGVLQPTTIGEGTATIQGALGGAGLGNFALKVMGIGGLDLDGTLRAAASRGEARILTRPILLATNNEEAEIVVGSQRPFVQVQRSLPTDAASRDQVVQYKEVGTKLTVRPIISSDGSVQLEVTQEVSTATAEVAFNAPVISTRSIRTQLLVRDGQTVALGGLTDRLQESRQEGLPFLSAIPLLGGLFGGAKRQTVETELFVFLTPRIIRNDDDATRVTTPLRDRARVP